VYLKSLTLRGFKSFASATTLVFEPGLTAIVGPNGSGKSNIVDALSWVMGEQGVKSLRGARMEDVIFAGTSGRAPLGRAEVTLTIDNTDQALPIDFTEVTISRTLFRTGGSEYAINGHPCRLLDVQELLSDTGMGREMHVVVGQGQLDTILAATPDVHRGFIEEAAGVLKHRRRKERAARKLDATQANLARLSDLIAEIRRQLKPLGRQAEVARRAGIVQANLRDARARLLADDLARAREALQTDLADEAAALAVRERCERSLREAQLAEDEAGQAAAAALPALSAAQDVWYGLSSVRERTAMTAQVAAERVRHAAQAQVPLVTGRDPGVLEAEADEARAEERTLRLAAVTAEETLAAATAQRSAAEQARLEADRAYAAAVRAAADAREGRARLDGRASALRSRLQAGAEEEARLAARAAEAGERAEIARRDHADLADRIAACETAQGGQREAADEAERAWEAARSRLAQATAEATRLEREHAGASARLEALELSLADADATGALVEHAVAGVLGALAERLHVEPDWRTAVAAALGPATEALVVSGPDAAAEILALLAAQDWGRAQFVVGGSPLRPGTPPAPAPAGGRWALEAIEADDLIAGALARLLATVVLVDDLAAARAVILADPEATAVTRDGALLSRWRAEGGSAGGMSRLDVQAAAVSAREQRATLESALVQARSDLAQAGGAAGQAEAAWEGARASRQAGEEELAGLVGRAALVAQTEQAARAEAERIGESITAIRETRRADEATLTGLDDLLSRADAEGGVTEPDPGPRETLAAAERAARVAETEARLALRTAEERAGALAGRADALIRAATAERQRAAAAAGRAEAARREGEAAGRVVTAARWLLGLLETSLRDASAAREAAEARRIESDATLAACRRITRERAGELEALVEGVHKDELARMEQRLRVEGLSERALTDLGLDADALLAEYGPDQPVPVLLTPLEEAEGLEPPEPVPYDRAAQQARLRTAERDLELLGRVNPLALEEFDAMSQRHTYLAGQLDDLKRTRTDLLGIIDEVDARVQEVFATAFTDVAAAFAQVFARLFPGGEGRLVLTDPDDLLNTGVEVEARPAGKKVKRLSLLSGGERSLVAVAFLLSLFIARPSPFYILDEVEAALDETNLSRLLEVYADLRRTSQLLIITHQKRTMEIADALYGVTMRGDGVSAVVSQRLVDR